MQTEILGSLRPAKVLGVGSGRLRLEASGGEFWARSALGPSISLNTGDEVLVAGEDELYVIGVLALAGGTGAVQSSDLRLDLPGRVEIRAGREIVLDSPRVTIRAEKIEFTANTLLERFVNQYRWIKETVLTRAGRMRTSVSGHYTLRAERIMASAEKDVKINGTKIHLG